MKNKKKVARTTKNKLGLSEKLVLIAFVKACPKIINLWKESKSDLTFDTWLLSQLSNLDNI